jgi:hypothetical protein
MNGSPTPVPPRARERGSMLIVALGILTLMSLLAVTFVILMNLERSAAANYVDSIKAKMVAEAGIQRIVADIHRLAAKPVFNGATLQPFIYHNDGRVVDVSYPVEKLSRAQDPYFIGVPARSYSTGKAQDVQDGVGVDEYRVKVIEANSLIDLNFEPFIVETGQPPLPRQSYELILQALGEALQARFGMDPVAAATFDGPNGHMRGAAAIVAFRASIDGRRFSSKAQLQEIVPEDAFRILRDYVTCHAWRDEKAVVADTGQPMRLHHKVDTSPRPPLNANLAPKECLIAAIAPIAGRRFVIDVSGDVQQMEQDDPKRYFGPTGSTRWPNPSDYPLKETKDFTAVNQGFVFIGRLEAGGRSDYGFSLPKASKIADWIIAHRPFKSYAHFYALLKAEMDNPAGGALDAYMPSPDVGQGEFQLFRPQQGFIAGEDTSAVPQKPWFKQFLKDAGYSMLLANFGASFTPSDCCPNSAAYLPIDKGSLLWPQDPLGKAPQGTVITRQTFDFCFDTKGTYEVTSLGEIRGRQGEVLAQEKIFSVVKIMDQVTQRSQYDFELHEASLDQTGERSDYTSIPENKLFFQAGEVDVPKLTDPASGPIPYGHLEVAPRLRYDNGVLIAGGTAALCAKGGNNQPIFGKPIFGAFFDGGQREAKPGPGAYLHADCFNGSDQPAVNRLMPPVFARARGNAPNLLLGIKPPNTPMPWDSNDPVDSTGGLVLGGEGLLFRDGFYSSYRYGYDKSLWYRAGAGAQGIDNPDIDYAQGAVGPEAPPESNGAHPNDVAHEGNLYYRHGGIEFWYKPEYDWSYKDPTSGNVAALPMFCGLACGTRVFLNPGDPGRAAPYGPAPMMAAQGQQGPTPTDVTQFYIFRNADGFLRATRIFARCVGDPQDKRPGRQLPDLLKDPIPGDAYGTNGWFVPGPYVHAGAGGVVQGPVELYREAAEAVPFSATGGPGGTPTGYPWPPAEFKKDEYEVYARTDAWVPFDPNAISNPSAALSPLARWKSNEWHHIAVYWDDNGHGQGRQPGNWDQCLRIYVDGVFASQAYGLPENPNGPMHEDQFCRLNEPALFEMGSSQMKLPRDSLYLGGIERRLARLHAGIFKHDNKVAPKGGSPDAEHVQLYACGTIDDAIVYDGETAPQSDFYTSLTRFQPRAEYAQYISGVVGGGDLLSSRFPDGTKPLELARISFEALLPTHHGGQDPKAQGEGSVKLTLDGNTGIKLEQLGGGGAGPSVTYDDMSEPKQPSNVRLLGPNGPAVIRPGQILKYRLDVKAADFQGGKLSSKAAPTLLGIDTPVINEVSVSYFLPVEDTLLKERIVD